MMYMFMYITCSVVKLMAIYSFFCSLTRDTGFLEGSQRRLRAVVIDDEVLCCLKTKNNINIANTIFKVQGQNKFGTEEE